MPNLDTRMMRARALADSRSPDSVLKLLQMLLDPSPTVRTDVLEQFRRAAPRHARVAARVGLGDTLDLNRCLAVELIGEAGAASDEALLRQVLRTDPEWTVRSTAADQLAGYPSAASTQALIHSFQNDPHEVVRRDAALALAGRAEVDPAVVRHALSSEQEPLARVGLLWLEYTLGNGPALDAILDFILDPERPELVATNAVNCIEVDRLQSVDRQRVRSEVARAIQTTGEPLNSELRSLLGELDNL